MQGDIADLAAHLAATPGLAGKEDIATVVGALGVGGDDGVPVGDDCAAIPRGDAWDLLACEGMIAAFVAASPWFAGWSAVMVNLGDVAAMGGRPVALVNALWDDGGASPLLRGMAAAAAAYGVPIVGGHSNLRSPVPLVAVAVLGRARALMTSFDARPGDALVVAIDLRGVWHAPFAFWNAATGAPPARLRGDLELLPCLAESGRARAAKDISQAGLVGTAAMLAECSGVGVTVDPGAVPRPAGADLARWLAAFPSFGYLLAVPPAQVDAVAAPFAARGIAVAACGRFDETGEVALAHAGTRAVVRDLGRAPLIGCAPTRAVRGTTCPS